MDIRSGSGISKSENFRKKGDTTVSEYVDRNFSDHIQECNVFNDNYHIMNLINT